MPKKAWTKAELRAIWKDYAAHGYNSAATAAAQKVPVSTLQHRLRVCRMVLGVKEPEESKAENRKRLTTGLSDADIIATWRTYNEAGCNGYAAARKLKVPVTTMQRRLEACQRALAVPESDQRLLDARDRQRLHDTIARLEREKRELAREANAEEDLRRSVFKLADAQLPSVSLGIKTRASKTSAGVPMLLASDFQWGEVIRAAELDGINEFNQDVARRRYKDLIARTLDLCVNHTPGCSHDVFYYWRLGDMVSGEIHEELRETNDLHSIGAVLDLTAHEKAAILELLKVFRTVIVITVPGNHGRTTIKPHAKRYVEANYDYLSGCMLEREFKGDPRVQFHTPLSGDAIIELWGWRFLGTHGDRIGSRGGQGFIGPIATITRGMKRVADEYAKLGKPIDFQFIGHFHTSVETEYGWCNGSLPGYSEYARQFRLGAQPPAQWLLFAHPKYGIGARWKILLEPHPRIPDAAVKAFDKAA